MRKIIVLFWDSVVTGLFGIFTWFIPSEKLSRPKQILIFLLAVAISVFCAYETGEIEGFSPESCVQSAATEREDSPVTADEEETASAVDYRPGHENVYGNGIYSNQGGRVCRQDEMYYFGTESGIFKCKGDLNEPQKICDDAAISLNVVASTLYYSTADGIYSIRTDGSGRERLTSLGGYAWNMQYYSDVLFYIDSTDNHLYRLPVGVGTPERVNDDLMSNFLLHEYSAYYLEWKPDEQFGLYSDGTCNYKRTNTYGGDSYTVIEPEPVDREYLENNVAGLDGSEMFYATFAPLTVAFDRQTNTIYYFAMSSCMDESSRCGLYSLNLGTNEKKWLLTGLNGESPCLVDGYVYYLFWDDSVPEGSSMIRKFARYDIASNTNEVIGNPKSDELNVCGFYPIGDTIIFNTYDGIWYSYDIAADELDFFTCGQ